VNGRIELRRRRWHHREGSVTPMDPLVELTEATVSLGVRELCCRLNGGATSFDKAAADLDRAAQVKLSGELLRQVVEAEGKQVLALTQEGEIDAGWRARDAVSPGGRSRVYHGTDGVMIPAVTEQEKRKRRQRVRAKRQRRGRRCKPLPSMKRGADQAYKEFKIVTFYDQALTHRLVSATQGNHEAAGRLMRRDANRLRLWEAQERIGNVDGAVWIRNQIHKRRLGLTALGLDFYHLSEHVHEVGRAIDGDSPDSGDSWAGELLHTVKHEGYDAFWERLTDKRSHLRSRSKRWTVDQLMHYVAERRDMICYPEFLAHGWRIGSGPTESMCKQLPHRLKGSGMRWDRDNAEAVMALEALQQSHQWPQYWATAAVFMN